MSNTYPETLYRFEVGGICKDYPKCEHHVSNISPQMLPLATSYKNERGILMENYCIICSVFANDESEVSLESILHELRLKFNCDERYLAYYAELLHGFHIISKEENIIGGLARPEMGSCIIGGELYEVSASAAEEKAEESGETTLH